ncbi:MAG TPA: hypothetical protein VLT86_18180, partial [Vicinamibacterales bacterium]|nr:hypothetical protein [Vicinamibacterales bacterium]
MRRVWRLWAVAVVMAVAVPVGARQPNAPAPIAYHVTFPAAEHHWMQVEVTWTGLGTAPLQARMSR